jgi:CHAT domain-containing protein
MYQEAVKQFHPAFNETDPSKNPDDFTAVYSYINLFNTLCEKASAQAALYRIEKKHQNLTDALNSYETAYALADYVERTYDSDEARLFLNKLKHTVHSRPIDICLLLFELRDEKDYLEKAYYFDQRNKASVLAFHVQEMQFRSSLPQINSLVTRESSIRTAITRFSLQALNTNDSSKLSILADTVRDLNIELGRLQEKINEEPAWQNIGHLQKLPTINDLGKRLDKKTALLSYHLSEKELVTLVVYQGKLDYHKQPIDSIFFSEVDSFKTFLHKMPESGLERTREIGKQLYQKLISPVLSRFSKATRLIIIPDDELNYLPFEALLAANGKYLVEELAVQYQFSTALLGAENDPDPLSNILAFAPFNKKGITDSSARFSALPASEQEIKELPGEILLDSAATKQAFLDKAKNFGIIHLATHANVSNEDPFGSYIAFFPGKDFRLYSAEISNLKLSSAQLVILSACETGTGKLIKGEGLMSLSRAFAYAGCHNIITSLWMAEDLSTAYLSKRLHHYLEKNYTKDEALRKAKVDLLNDPAIDPRLKLPSFWAHLVFIGHYEKEARSAGWIWLILIPVIAAIIFFFLSGRISKY